MFMLLAGKALAKHGVSHEMLGRSQLDDLVLDAHIAQVAIDRSTGGARSPI
jgi:hypothetical protein